MGSVTLIAVVTEADDDVSPLVASLRRQRGAADWELIVVDTAEDRGRRLRTGRKTGQVRLLSQPAATIAEAASKVFGEASGEFLGFVGPADVLAPEAIATLIETAGPEVDVVYSDEDRIAEDGRYTEPFYKPDWSPDRLRCQPYTGSLTLLRRELADAVGGVRPESGKAFEWDLVLRVSEAARQVEHCPQVLIHRRMPSYLGGHDLAAERRVVEEHLHRMGFLASPEHDSGVWHLRPRLQEEPLVSVVIPTAGRTRAVYGSPTTLVVNCLEHLISLSTYSNYEIVCVASDEVGDTTRAALHEVGGERLRFVDNPGVFNFARAINLGALHAKGEYLLLLNDDTQVITPDWIEAMLIYGQDPGVGAVGAKLLFADGRLQHAGIIATGRGGPGHPYYGFPGDYEGYAFNLVVPSNYLAVTAACLLTARDRFEEVGGFATQFPLNYNDIDYCLKLRHRGYRVVFTPETRLYHFELSSRITGAIAREELRALDARWGTVFERDPFYNPNFLPSADFLPPVRSAAEVRRSRAAPLTDTRVS